MRINKSVDTSLPTLSDSAESRRRVIEADIAWFHRQHLNGLSAKILSEVVRERMADAPDHARIRGLVKEAIALESEKRDRAYARARRDLVD